jgi:hypothetical protein
MLQDVAELLMQRPDEEEETHTASASFLPTDAILNQLFMENEKNQKLKESELKRFHITEKIKLIFYLNSFQLKYSQLNESLKMIVFKEIKNFVEIDPDESFKVIVATITEVAFDWTKLAIYIDYDGCKRLIKMFDKIGAFSVDQVNHS